MNKQHYLRYSVALLCLATSMTVYGQQSVAVSGGEAKGAGGSASYTVGLTAYTTVTGTGGSAQQGVQHTYTVSIISSELHQGVVLDCEAFPNPAIDILVLRTNLATDEDLTQLRYVLTDINGKLLIEQKMAAIESHISMNNYPAGAYQLCVFADDKVAKIFKIVKN